MSKTIEITQIKAIELDPDKHYLIAIDKAAGLDMADMKLLNSEIKKTGVKRAILVIIDGNPHDRMAVWSTVRKDGDEQRTP